ncbi:MAG: hypothetical protein GWO24_02605, partial [Akkermansiaceae bacterium]|nr:hypothetical protein [Akkermansiaceae bacterium]
MTRKKKAPLEPAQLQQFLRTVLSIEEVKVVDQRRQEGMRKVTDNDRRPFWELIQTLAMLGLRIGEAVGLRWFRLNLTDQPL